MVTKWDLLYGQSTPDESSSIEEDSFAIMKEKLEKFLINLTEKYANADLLDLYFEKNAEYSANTEEGARNLAKVMTTKNIYEALMEFMVVHGQSNFNDTAEKLLKLHEKYLAVSVLLKVDRSITLKACKKF